MPALKNSRHELFAQGIASGLSASESYRRASSGKSGKNADKQANQMRKVAGVEARITELKAESNCKSQLSRDEALEFLAEVITTPAGAIGPHHRLCQAHKMTKGDGWEAHEVKLPDKMVAMQMVCRMCGWEKPTKFSLSGDDTLSTYLLELRRQPIGGLPAPDSAKPVNGTVLPAYFRHTKAELWVEWRREPLAHRQF